MSNTTVPEAFLAPVVPAFKSIDLWLQTPKRSTEEQILKLLHQNQLNPQEETHFLVESMLEENKHYFHQMAYIRWALVGASLSVFSFFFASFLQGVSVFQTAAPGASSVPLSDAARAFTIAGAFLLAVGIIITCIELSEVLTPKIKIDRVRVEHEKERSSLARASSPVPRRKTDAPTTELTPKSNKIKETETSSTSSERKSSKSSEEEMESRSDDRKTSSSDDSDSS